MSQATTEIYRTAVPPYPTELPNSGLPKDHPAAGIDKIFNNVSVSIGLPYTEACKKHAEQTFHASRIYILSSTTLADKTPALQDLETTLQGKIVGTKKGLRPHTLWGEVLEVANDCRRLDVDLVITLGGSTLSDAAKLAVLAVANDVTTHEEFSNLPEARFAARVAKPATIPIISVATTLSGAEYTNGAGATDDRNSEKVQFLTGPGIKLLVLDPALLTAYTPPSLLLQSGIRAVDHSVESLCSTWSNAVSDEHAMSGLKLLIPGLLRCHRDFATNDLSNQKDVEARRLCQLGVSESVAATFRVYTPLGGSHAIGHILGPFGVGHGETSCILLPAVCAYNYRHGANVERQDAAAKLLWSIPELRAVAEEKGLREGEAHLADLVDALVHTIGMPRSLKAVGVGRDKFSQIAELSLHDVWCATNPIPLTKKEQVLEILESVSE